MTCFTRRRQPLAEEASFSGGHIMVIRIVSNDKGNPQANSRMPSCGPKGQEKGNVPDEGSHTDRADRVLAKD
jgi:hypothetical protein